MTQPPLADAEVRARLARALGAGYELRRLICRGARADLYEVWDGNLGRRLALKVLRPDAVWTPEMLARVRESAARLTKLRHAGILPIYFVGEGEGLVWLARPFVDGESLDTSLRLSGPHGADLALELVSPLLDALAEAHREGLAHEGITPSNILIETPSRRPVLADFGVAQLADCAPARRPAVSAAPSPYVSPEEQAGRPVDARSDVYAMGAVLFQVATALLPFESTATAAGSGTRPAPEPRRELPRWLADVLLRAVARNPEDRYPDAGALRGALIDGQRAGPQDRIDVAPLLRRLRGGEPTVLVPEREPSVPTAPSPRPVTAPRRRSAGFPRALVALAVLVAAAAGLYFAFFSRPVLAFTNPLVAPVRLVVDDGPTRMVAPGETVALRLSRRPVLVAEWTLERPLSPDGVPLGEPLRGSVAVRAPRGRIARAASSRGPEGDFFAPLVTNATDRPLRLVVNAGLEGATDCRCAVRPGARRAFIGYYPLFRNSTVQARAGTARATFRDLGSSVSAADGTVGLRFNPADLAR